jgi:pyruvate formate-lyase 1-activating enzyme
MTKYSGYINSIETMGLVDGPGIRVVFFMQGCPLRCLYCHNPETWEKKSDFVMTPEEVVDKILKYKNYFGEEGGVTFSGGEPLLQKDFLLETLKLCKKEGINTALDTCGVTDEDYNEILDYIDLVIMDIKAIEKEEYKYITSSNIDKSLKFIDDCQNKNKKMWFRQVIVPGINDTEEQILKLKKFSSKYKNIEKIELLPYQTLGVHKYEELGIPYRLKNVEPMDEEKCGELNKLLV